MTGNATRKSSCEIIGRRPLGTRIWRVKTTQISLDFGTHFARHRHLYRLWSARPRPQHATDFSGNVIPNGHAARVHWALRLWMLPSWGESAKKSVDSGRIFV